MQLTQGQQYIAAADKTANLIAAQSTSEGRIDNASMPDEPKQEPKEHSFVVRLLQRISGKGNRTK